MFAAHLGCRGCLLGSRQVETGAAWRGPPPRTPPPPPPPLPPTVYSAFTLPFYVPSMHMPCHTAFPLPFATYTHCLPCHPPTHTRAPCCPHHAPTPTPPLDYPSHGRALLPADNISGRKADNTRWRERRTGRAFKTAGFRQLYAVAVRLCRLHHTFLPTYNSALPCVYLPQRGAPACRNFTVLGACCPLTPATACRSSLPTTGLVPVVGFATAHAAPGSFLCLLPTLPPPTHYLPTA